MEDDLDKIKERIAAEREWWYSLSEVQKRQIEDLQWKLCEEGFGKDTDFKMKTCWEEAVKRLQLRQIGV